jgi:transcriptional regulator with XRE-family HTH domain
MTQSELSRISGIRQPNLCRIENGQGNLSASTIAKLSGALQITPSQFISDAIFLQQNRSSTLTRDELEQIAEGVIGNARHLSPRLSRIVSAYQLILPAFNKRHIPKHKTYMAWLDLKTVLSREEIRNLRIRIGKARQRQNES